MTYPKTRRHPLAYRILAPGYFGVSLLGVHSLQLPLTASVVLLGAAITLVTVLYQRSGTRPAHHQSYARGPIHHWWREPTTVGALQPAEPARALRDAA